MLERLFKPTRFEAATSTLYRAIVAQARQPIFYTTLGVPDTVDGRFELIALHAFLVLQRLKGQGEEARQAGQALFDLMFADMDQNLREMGAGDLGVGPRVKTMARAFYGRIAAYEEGLSDDDTKLAEALRRNLFGTCATIEEKSVTAIGSYLRRQVAGLANQELAGILSGQCRFGMPGAPA
ncbi:MAG: hypothetical protein FJX52_06075 [Alphaproteobacteria bacterium]|nr:hypothetical protein [Alphaproteobacteria bacterium]